MANLAAYVIRRVILLVFVVIGVTVLVFAVSMMFPPEERAYLYVKNPQELKPTTINATIIKYGLDQPFYIQYGNWFRQLLSGNLGYSVTAHQYVTDSIRQKWPFTFEIVLFAAPIIIFLGIYLGVQAAVHRNDPIDHASRVFSIIGWSLPSFWVGMLLLAIFFGYFHWFEPNALSVGYKIYIGDPTNHFVQYTGVNIFDGLLNGKPLITLDAIWHCVLPVVVIVTIDVALLIRVMRSSMLESMSKPYITTARAKGLSKKVVIYKHARRNALIPVATLSGMLVAGLLGGLIITETVFGFPGLGQWAAVSAQSLDMAAVLGYAILSAIVFVIANLIVDVMYAYIDPRIRLD